MFSSNFLNQKQAEELAAKYGTPLFVYSKAKLVEQARAAARFKTPFDHTVRYAMKSNPNMEILKIFKDQGIKIDASSGYEAELAMAAGFRGEDILLTSQQLAHNLTALVNKGVQFNATSLRQLEEFGKKFPGSDVSVRINPGVGSGHSVKTNVGGRTSSFGIWHEYIPEVQKLADKYGLKIVRMHTHIGSGADPAVWEETARVSLELSKNFPDAETINLGGGFKVARMDEEKGTNIQQVGAVLARELELFGQDTGRQLHLEIEPGTFLVANAGVLIAKVDDIVDTGQDGYTFIKLDTGMNDILRPTLYGAQHPIAVLNNSSELKEYVVVGHNCESGDLLTPAPGEPEVLAPRHLQAAAVGDLVLIGGAGAYCASMAAHGYNSYPGAKEVIV